MKDRLIRKTVEIQLSPVWEDDVKALMDQRKFTLFVSAAVQDYLRSSKGRKSMAMLLKEEMPAQSHHSRTPAQRRTGEIEPPQAISPELKADEIKKETPVQSLSSQSGGMSKFFKKPSKTTG